MRSVADFGCGTGSYVKDLRAAGIRAGGFDGNPATSEISEGRCIHQDLSQTLDLGIRWDWVLTLEVVEHIPPDLESLSRSLRLLFIFFDVSIWSGHFGVLTFLEW